ncbi:MAG: zf-HC2 domain-containing protein [Candidatus Poribacteria bacterium]|nr:zf-HC2 domain-containing protein [Candidatus Poribacteria bacterium]
MQCDQVEKELSQMLEGTLDPALEAALGEHLEHCVRCRQTRDQLERLPELLKTWGAIEPTMVMYDRLQRRLQPSLIQRWLETTWIWKTGAFVAALLFIGIGLGTFNLWWGWHTAASQIQQYASKHQIAQRGTLTLTSLKSGLPRISLEHLIAYQILRGSTLQEGMLMNNGWGDAEVDLSELSEQLIDLPITLAEAEREMPFTVIAPPYLHPGYLLDGIRRIDGRDALHLVYTNGIDTLSIFEQPISRGHRLGDAILQQHVIRQKEGKVETIVLSWIAGDVAFSLVGEGSMPRLVGVVERLRNQTEDVGKVRGEEIGLL